MLFMTIAYILSSVGARWCRFLYRTYVSSDPSYPFFRAAAGGQGIGIFGYESNGACIAYPYGMEVDTKLNSARVFCQWTTIVGIFLLMLSWFSACLGMSNIIWAGMGFFALVNSLFEGLTLLMKMSAICDPTYGSCTLNTGARCCIAAIVFWLLAGLSVATVPAPTGPEPVVIQETTTTTTRVEPDGTTVTETKVDRVQVPTGL